MIDTKLDMRNKNYGFTLIELLIVIGILGILAAGLLAAVDPFEQLKKGRDTNRRNVVVETNDALIRYYATHGDLPWSGSSATCTSYTSGGAPVTFSEFNGGSATALGADGTSCLASLINDGELKKDFISGVGGGDMDKFFIYSATGVDLSVCFAPESKASYLDVNAKWQNSGGASGFTDGSAGDCSVATKATTAKTAVPAYNVATACFFCAK